MGRPARATCRRRAPDPEVITEGSTHRRRPRAVRAPQKRTEPDSPRLRRQPRWSRPSLSSGCSCQAEQEATCSGRGRVVHEATGTRRTRRSEPRMTLNTDARTDSRSPWAWIPTLYLAEGLPYVIVMSVSVIMYKGFGISNTDIALYTSWLYLPWVIKPLWSPVVDLLGTRRAWIWVTQLVVGGCLAGVALTTPLPHAFQWTLAIFWLLAFDSATHDIAADGFYMLATTEQQQSFFVGVRSMFYRIATIAGQGLLVVLAGTIQSRTGNVPFAWSVA